MEIKTDNREKVGQCSSEIESILQSQKWKNKRHSQNIQKPIKQTINHAKSSSQVEILCKNDKKLIKLPSIKNKVSPYLLTMNLIKTTLNSPHHGSTNDQKASQSSKIFRFAIPYKILKDSLKLNLVGHKKPQTNTLKVPLFPQSPYGNHKQDSEIRFKDIPKPKEKTQPTFTERARKNSGSF
ncbi:unnamed protein product [Blepharisma stoltei]|uniref:Uncharacterized protein n=1 Tax=Blepharisma stoltei TaxID=1481888 RepID=A0AAU9IR37_9CILI|nr:unnamed protein product [Blepharisma stoltei]